MRRCVTACTRSQAPCTENTRVASYDIDTPEVNTAHAQPGAGSTQYGTRLIHSSSENMKPNTAGLLLVSGHRLCAKH